MLVTRLLACAALALALASCASRPAEQVCAPGSQVVCVCPENSEGVQTCRDDGRGYEPCRCQRVVPGADAGGDRDPDEPTPDVIEDTATEDAEEADVTEDAPTPDASEPEVSEDAALPDAPAPDAPDPDVSEDAEAPDVPEDVEEPTPDADTPDVPVSEAALGEPCAEDVECSSGLCLGFAVGGAESAVCARPCCQEALDCPRGFGCLQLGGASYCLPSTVFPPGFDFDGPVGSACSSGGDCQSDICDLERGCRGSCCTDADCTTTCRFLAAGSRYRTYCDSLGLLASPDGAFCGSEFDCASGICLPDAASPFGGVCTSLCCRSAQCGAGRVCGLVAGPGGGIARACVPANAGTLSDGEACTADAECLSDQCVGGACRSVCCRAEDCGRALRCMPEETTFGVTTLFCVPPPS